MGEGRMAARIREKLNAALLPVSLEVIDDSHRHAGHLAAREDATGRSRETHFTVKVVAQAFEGKSRIERHRMINGLLSTEIAEGIHALAIDAKAPEE